MNIAEKSLQLKQDFDDVYEAGYNKGTEETQLLLWKGLQNEGLGANYYYAFAYNRFDDNNYNPPYVIKSTDTTTGSQAIFYANELITDTKVEIIAAKNANYCFYNMSNCHTIRKFTVNENTSFTSAFNGTKNLINIEIGGTIGKTFDIHWSTELSNESIASIITSLSETRTSVTLTLSEDAVNKMTYPFTYKDVTYNSWDELIAPKSNWTISLA